MELIVLYPEIKAEEIGGFLNVSERTVQSYIKRIREVNLIEREGGRKKGYWVIKEQ